MRRRWLCIVVAMLLVALVVEGCRSGGMFQQYVTRNARGEEVLTGGCIRGQTSEECQSMRPVTITNNPSDEEFWQFKARLKNTLYWGPLGIPIVPIPFGPLGRRVPRDINVIGSQEPCEVVRARVTDPTESCKGPFYFHRDEK